METDRAALVALYNATNGPDWLENSNWLTDAPLADWEGVTTDDNGRVIGVEFVWQGWFDTGYGNNLGGELPAELGNLSRLERLELSNNNLWGTLPSELGNLHSLTIINLADNHLTGEIPLNWRGLPLYRFVFSSNNGLCAPAELRDWIERIEISNGPFCTIDGTEGTVLPDRAALVALYNATNGPEWLENRYWLTDAPLEDWYGVATDADGRVIRLELYDNGLTGDLPPELGSLSRLEHLELRGSGLSGPIPPEIGNLPKLTHLSLYGEDLRGPIPRELGNLVNLTFLDVFGYQLTGPLPPELGNLFRLDSLSLCCDLAGSIPPELGNLVNLTFLDVDGDGLAGPIPPELGNLSSLGVMQIYGGKLEGSIPPELGNLGNLASLDISGKSLAGPIPAELGNLSNLSDLELCCNLTGSIPPELGNLVNLTFLDVTGNQLTGPLPPELGQWENLEYLRLSDNSLSGELPESFAGLTALRQFSFAGNAGLCVPPALRNWFDRLERVQGFNCPSTAPEYQAERAALIALYNATNGPEWVSSRNWLSAVPTGEWYGVTTGDDDRVIRLDLRSNGLNGSLPPELGSLSHLSILDLHSNDLSGAVPPELGNLSELNYLEIGYNQLMGEIPQSFTKLSNLKVFAFGGNADLCAPASLHGWLENIMHRRGSKC